MPDYGLLIDYEFCTGCHTCEVACKQELNLPAGKWGIKIFEFISDYEIAPDKYEFAYMPFPTSLCNLCDPRVKKGGVPSCVKHCQANVMKYGKIEELAKEAKGKAKTVIWVPI